MIWDYYRHHAVRDLAWSVFSPPLMAALADVVIDEQIATQQDIDWFNQLDFAPAELLAYIAERQSRRLGIYFENLLAYYFRHHRRWQLKTQNLQVTSQGRTLGAFDFLLYDEQAAQNLHLETAVKFYLGVPDFSPPPLSTAKDGGSAASAGAAQLPTAKDGGSAASAGAAQLPTASAWHQWIGPNSRDRLDIKLQHLQYRQLRLAEQSQSRAALAALGIDPHTLQRRLLMRGILFYPAHTSLPAPAHAHPDHLRGTWYYLADFLREKDDGAGEWTLLPRLQWLAEPQTAGHLDRAALQRHLRGHFEQESAPVMLSRRVQRESYVDTLREIIVPDYWPRTT